MLKYIYKNTQNSSRFYKNTVTTIKIMQLCITDTIVSIQINETKNTSIHRKQKF